MQDLRQLSLFDDLALGNNCDLAQNEPLALEKNEIESLVKTIKEKLLEFDRSYPVYSTLEDGICKSSYVYHKLMDEKLQLGISHGYFSYNSHNQTLKANDKLGIHFSLRTIDGEINYCQSNICINYTKEENKEFYNKEELKALKLDETDLANKLKLLEEKLQIYLKKEKDSLEPLTKPLIQTIKEALIHFNQKNPIKMKLLNPFLEEKIEKVELGEGMVILINHEGYKTFLTPKGAYTAEGFGTGFTIFDKDKNELISDVILFDLNLSAKLVREHKEGFIKQKYLKDLEISINETHLNDKLNILQLKLQNYFKGENDDRLKDLKNPNKTEARADLQQSSKFQPLSMGLTQPTSTGSLREFSPNETKGAEFTNRIRADETRRDESRPTQTSTHTGKIYRMANETRDRAKERTYEQSCETFARNSLSNDEKLAKNSQKLLNYAESVKEYEQALLNLYLSTKTQKELEHFHKIKALYANFSQKFREKDMHSKLEEKYETQKDKLSKEQKEKMLDDYILALSTDTKLKEMKESTKDFLAHSLIDKTQSLMNKSEEVKQSQRVLKELLNLKNTKEQTSNKMEKADDFTRKKLLKQ